MRTRNDVKALIAGFRLLDDDFMREVFDNNIPATQYLLDILLGHQPLTVKSVVTQRDIKSVQGRSVRLDVFAEDDRGRQYDVEIQREDRGAGQRRARFYADMMDTKQLNTGDDFNKLRETYVIFITENDVFGKGLPILHIERRFDETGEPFDDGMHIIYVNGAYRNENDEIGRLMHDFHCREPQQMHESPLQSKVRYLKENGEGYKQMCKAVEEFMKDILEEERKQAIAKGMEKGMAKGMEKGMEKGMAKGMAEGEAKGKAETLLESAKAFLKAGLATPEQVAETLHLPLAQVQKLAEELK